MDNGDILAQEPLQLTGGETAGALGETVAQKAAQMLPKVLAEIAEGNAAGLLQNHSEATYCPLIAREDGLIDWNRSAVEIDAMVRAYNPWPLCRTAHNGKELFILQSAVTDSVKAQTPGLVLGIDKQQGILVQTGEGILAVTELQYEAKKALQWRAFVNGARDFIGAKLG
jgi:methionyl-tRNA formyltransferase